MVKFQPPPPPPPKYVEDIEDVEEIIECPHCKWRVPTTIYCLSCGGPLG